MNSRDPSSPLPGDTQAGVTRILRYRFHKLPNSADFTFDALVKEPFAVRFLQLRWPTRPTVDEMIRECSRRGELCLRPYYVGQDSDVCASVCVFALLHDYCRSAGINATDLMERSYPGTDAPTLWSAEAWQRTREEAEWQGTIFPHRWHMSTLVALMHSLYNLDRRVLMDALLQAIVAQAVAKEPT
jgi:hypothetical protein